MNTDTAYLRFRDWKIFHLYFAVKSVFICVHLWLSFFSDIV